jgi:hypothetical protein
MRVQRIRSFNAKTFGPATCKWFESVMRAEWLRPIHWETIDGGWRELWQYRRDTQPIVIEDHASHGSYRDPPLVQDEIRAFNSAVAALPASPGRDAVQAHLSATGYITVAVLPDSADAKGREAAFTLLAPFVAEYAGLIHVELEGFYTGKLLLLPTPDLELPFEHLPGSSPGTLG